MIVSFRITMTKKNNDNQNRDELIRYGYLLKRSLKFSLEVIIILVLLFHWELIFNLIRSIYRF